MKRIAIDGGRKCPKCKRWMQRYRHPADYRPKPNQNYYFEWWDVCPCKHTQHYEEAKRHSDQEKRLELIVEQLKVRA